jgi:molybdopterin-containing oxidoreductase family iron-sulfur binding subunit
MSDFPQAKVELLGVRRRLDGQQGRTYWRSLEELAATPQFLEFLHREFPEQASEFDDPAGRRHFLKMMGASLALAGLTGCTRQPEEKIVAYVKAPEGLIPGRPVYFATAVVDGGYAKGVLVESHLGRPTKIEGNPDHPASLGATDAIGQAAVLGLYDPDRSQTLTYMGEIRGWAQFLANMRSAVAAQRAVGGAGLRILTETVTSPTLAAQIEGILSELPAARWHQWEPAGRDSARAGALAALGRPAEIQYRFDQAALVLSLDADFVSDGPANLRHIRDFTSRRRLDAGRTDMCRLYVIESTPGLAGAMADHRLGVKASQVEAYAGAIAAALGAAGGGAAPAGPHAPWVAALVKDLQERPAGTTLVIPGEYQSPAVHALAYAINERLGNVGRTVIAGAPVEARPVDQMASLRELVADMDRGSVSLLMILGSNPVFTAPYDFDFAGRLEKVALRVHLGLHDDETAERCHWHIPQTHSLESWSDARAFEGTVTIVQPLIAPLYPGAKSAHEVLGALTGRPERTGYELVREFWRTGRIEFGAVAAAAAPAGTAGSPAPASPVPAAPAPAPAAAPDADFERTWRRALHDGMMPAAPPGAAAARAAAPAPAAAPRPPAAAGLEIIFRPDPTIVDGRFANNGWLQELPKPLTKLTWDNAALMSPATARALGIAIEGTSNGNLTDVVELAYRGRTVRAPAWIVPGHPDDAVTVHFGYGRRRAGRVGNGTGFDAFSIRTSDAPWFGSGLEVRKTGERYTLACTQDHWSMEGRDPVRAGTLESYRHHPEYAQHVFHEPKPEDTLYPPFKYEGHAWGMSIDLNSCVGCNACVLACVAENNIPVVGKEMVARGREMHWIRIDRYYAGGENDPQAYHQPVPCMHCENAPCEVVCPVAATVHSDEGLNDMVYNRCVGTRYCSNNCPYKVRRFNFFLYQDWDTSSLKLMRNPDVTVRSRGVMEKCTYCVQRINQAKMEATVDGRALKDGDIVTACQAVCPAHAITFGDINDHGSAVARLKAEPRNYSLLGDLNTRPRTTYLAAVRNPNPALAGEAPEGAGTAPHHS